MSAQNNEGPEGVMTVIFVAYLFCGKNLNIITLM